MNSQLCMYVHQNLGVAKFFMFSLIQLAMLETL